MIIMEEGFNNAKYAPCPLLVKDGGRRKIRCKNRRRVL